MSKLGYSIRNRKLVDIELICNPGREMEVLYHPNGPKAGRDRNVHS